MPHGSDPNSNKTTIRMVTANHDNTIHASAKVDLRSFRERDTLLDVTKVGFGADNINAPYIESVFEGVKTIGHEITQIGNLRKFWDSQTNPNVQKDGFQAYFVVVSNGQTEKAGLPLEVKGGQKEFLSADGTTVEKLKEIIDKLPDGAELVVVWRRDVEKTKDITYIDQSSAVVLTNNVYFEMPKCAGCAANGKDVLLDDGLYLFTDTGADRITFSSSIVSLVAITSDYLVWDAGIFPTIGLLNQVPVVAQEGQRFAYLDGINLVTSEKVGLDFKEIKYIQSMFQLVLSPVENQKSELSSENSKLARVESIPQIFVLEESIIIRLLMNPTERKLWGKMYGLPDDEEARAFTRGDDFKNITRVREEYNYDPPKDDPKKGGFTDNSSKGFTMSNENKIEKTESPQHFRLAFSELFLKPELKVENTESDVEDDSYKFGMKVVIGDLKPKKKKTIKRKQESAFIPPKLLDLLARNKRTKKNKEHGSKEIKPKEQTPSARKRNVKSNPLPLILTRDAKEPRPRKKTTKELKREEIAPSIKKSEKKKIEVARSEQPKVAKRDMVVLGGSPFAAVISNTFGPKPVATIAKAKKIDKDYKLSWMLNKTGNKFKKSKRERTNR